MKKRNLKNFNHWLAEVREIAAKGMSDEHGKKWSKIEINNCFTKDTMQSYFNDNLLPNDALWEEVSNWEE